MNIRQKQVEAKNRLVRAYADSETKSISDITKRAGVSRHTFYDYFNTDAEFRKQFLEKQREHLAQKIAAA